MHSLYVDATSNPFHNHGQPVKSLRFDLAYDNLVRQYNQAGLPAPAPQQPGSPVQGAQQQQQQQQQQQAVQAAQVGVGNLSVQ
jgi:hypothetical protein